MKTILTYHFSSIKSILLLSFGLLCLNSSAQQLPHFNKGKAHDFMLNPGASATYDYQLLQVSMRRQWTKVEQAPITQVFGYASNIEKANLGWGLHIINDKAGAISYTGIYANLAYLISFEKSKRYRYGEFLRQSKIGFGLTAGIIQYRLNAAELLVTDANDPSILNANVSQWGPDIAVGLQYAWKDKLYLGAGIPQLYAKTLVFEENADAAATIDRIPHFFFLAGGKIPINDDWSIEPHTYIKMVSNAPINANAGINLKLEEYGWIGLTYRTSNELAAEIGFLVINNIEIAYSFELKIGEMAGETGSSHEIVLSYKRPNRKRNRALSNYRK